MPVVEEKVQAVLIAASGVTALVQAKNIKAGFVGQGVSPPYIGHQPVTSNETRTSETRSGLQEWEYQISCFATTYSGAKAIAAAVQAVFNSYVSVDLQVTRSTLGPHIREDDVNVSQIPVLLTIWDSF